MAGYKAHLATGMMIGGISVVGALISATVNPSYTPLIFIAVIIGSFLPDLDSDTGLPVKILFSILGLLGSIIVVYMLKDSFRTELIKPLAIVSGCYAFIYFILQRIFKGFTKHRGIFHSIIAVIISILGLNYLLLSLQIEIFEAIFISLSLGVGYIGHLLLDEMNAVVNLSGLPFFPNKSLGSALKLVSKSKRVNIAAIVITIILLYSNFVLILNY
jgi:hypothetical protein